MFAGFVLTLATLSAVQTDRRPVVQVVSEDSAAVELRAQWSRMSSRGTGEYDEHEWEARDAANLLGSGRVPAPQVSFRINRPPLGDTLFVRVFVRGLGPEGAGPWGWASDPLIVTGLVDQPERRPSLSVERETSVSTHLVATWTPDRDSTAAPITIYEWEATSDGSLIAYGRVPRPTATIGIARPLGPRPTTIRMTVRGWSNDTPGPWSFASNPVVVEPVTEPLPRVGPQPREPRPAAVPVRPTRPPSPVTVATPAREAAPDPIRAAPETDQPDPGPHPVAATAGTHEPDAYITLTETPLATAASGFRDEDAPLSAPWVFPVVYVPGLSGGESPVTHPIPIPAGHREVYLRYAFKADRQFAGHPSALNRVMRIELGTVELFDVISGVGLSPLQYQVGIEGPRPPCQLAKPPPRARRLTPNQSAMPLLRDRWYTVELLIQPGTPGQCNGVIRAWFNGSLIVSYDDVGMGSESLGAFEIQAISLAPRWGTRGAQVEETFRLWIDGVYISGR